MSRVKPTAPTIFAVAPQREHAQLQHLAGRTVQLQFAFDAVAGERVLHEFGDRFFGEHFARAGTGEAPRHRVAHDFTTDAVDDHDGVSRLVEREQQPVLHGLGMGDSIFGVAALVGDRIGERNPFVAGCQPARVMQLPARLSKFECDHHNDSPPEKRNDDEERRHESRRGPAIIRIDR